MIKKFLLAILIFAMSLSFASCAGKTDFAAVAVRHGEITSSAEIKEFFTAGNFSISLAEVAAKINDERERELIDQIETSLNLSAITLNRYRGIILNKNVTGKNINAQAKELQNNLNNFYDALIELNVQKKSIEEINEEFLDLSTIQNRIILNDFVAAAANVFENAISASQNVIDVFKNYFASNYIFDKNSTSIIDNYIEISILSAYLDVLKPAFELFAHNLKNAPLFIYGTEAEFNSLSRAITTGERLISTTSIAYNTAAQLNFNVTKTEFLKAQISLHENLTAMQYVNSAISKFEFSNLEQKITESVGTYNGANLTLYLNTKISATLKGHYQYTTNALANNADAILNSIDLFLNYI